MRIGPPSTDRERAEALACLLGEESTECDRVRTALRLAGSGEIDLKGLVATWSGERAVASAVWWISADRSALLWPPASRPDARGENAVALVRDITSRADTAGCLFVQALLEEERPDQRHVLEAAGFRYLADLLYLRRPLDEPTPAPGVIDGRILGFREEDARRFAAAVERTYVGSRDCPGFAGLRSASEALNSYREAGVFTPERWRLVERDGRDEAVTIVNDRPDEGAREIVYLGVVPEARRTGLARALVDATLHEAARDGLCMVVTSVDASNSPAVRLYCRAGFFPVSCRSIFLRRQGGVSTALAGLAGRDDLP